MNVVGATYSCLIIFGQQVFEQVRTNTDTEIKRLKTELSKPVGEREVLVFEGERATCLFDPNVPGIAVQVISKREFESVQQQRRIATPVTGGISPPRGRG